MASQRCWGETIPCCLWPQHGSNLPACLPACLAASPVPYTPSQMARTCGSQNQMHWKSNLPGSARCSHIGTDTLSPGSSTRSGSANENTPAAGPRPGQHPAAPGPAAAAAAAAAAGPTDTCLRASWLPVLLLLAAAAAATAGMDGELCICGRCSCCVPLLCSKCTAAAADPGAAAAAAGGCCLSCCAAPMSAAPLDWWRRCMARCLARVMTSVPAAQEGTLSGQDTHDNGGEGGEGGDAFSLLGRPHGRAHSQDKTCMMGCVCVCVCMAPCVMSPCAVQQVFNDIAAQVQTGLEGINYMHPQLRPCNKPAAMSFHTSLPAVVPLYQAGARLVHHLSTLQACRYNGCQPVPCSAAQTSVLPAAAAAGPAPAAAAVAAPKATSGLLIAALRFRAANSPTLRNVTCTGEHHSSSTVPCGNIPDHEGSWCRVTATS